MTSLSTQRTGFKNDFSVIANSFLHTPGLSFASVLDAESIQRIFREEEALFGQDDIFSRAMIAEQLRNIDQHFDNLMMTGIPEEVRAYLGMMGFRIRINLHGEVLDVEQPGIEAEE